jgi:hypothetical protein
MGFTSVGRFNLVKHSIIVFLVSVLLYFMRGNKLPAFMYIVG